MEVPVKKRQEKVEYSRQPSSGSLSSLTNVHVNPGVPAHSQALFMQKVRESSEAVNRRDFRAAVHSYTEAITLDPTNHILYTNRSAAFSKLQQYEKSLLDARKARELNPKWAKAYIREGSALQQLGQHADALAAFASGLANDAGNTQLLSGLTEAAIKCPLKEKLEPIFQQLQKLKLDKSPFVIISVIGQELLQAGHYQASVQMLEASLKIGSCSLKLRGSVFSALSSAFWGMGNIDKAILYMQKDLQVAKSLGDTEGECRAYGNLGSAYFSKGHYKEALSHDRFQLVLAMRLKDRQTATVALGRLGHVYTAIGDYPNALQSHKQCVLLLKQSNEKLLEAREIGNVGAVYLAMGNFESALECHLEHLKIAKSLKNSVEEARAHSNLGSAHHYKRNYEKAIVYHKHVLKIAEQKGDKSLEARAYAGLGHAARCMQDYGNAKTYHEKQLDNALQTRDKVAEGRACSNLGIIFHQLGEYEPALKLHKVHLSIAKDLGDRASQGRALGNIGNANCSLKQFEQAIKFHKQELAMSTEVNDRHSEGSTHGNLAVAYQALKMMDSAHQHYVAHLNISRELKDSQSEARAVCNLGNFHSSRGEYTNSIPYYEQYLMLSQELHDSEGEGKACFCLGYAHFALGNFNESVRYYKQDLSIAQELKNQLGIARAVCNLGLAHKALDNYTDALECQKKCLQMMTTLKNVKGHFRALGNIGDIYLKTGDLTEAIKYYNQQLQLSKQCNNRDMTATANGSLGGAHRLLGQHDKALGYHTQELSIRQDMNDLRGECRAHGNIGSVHMCLGKYMNAYKCYEEQLEKSRELSDSAMEANACGNLAITKMNMGNFEEAIGLFEQQLAMLEQVHGTNSMFDRGRAFGSLGDCYEALGDFDESIKCHEQYLAIAQNSGNLSDQDKAYRGLGNAHRSVGNLQQALVCFEKRLVVAHELNSAAAKASAYGELGCLHSLLGNFEQAISCLQHQLTIAREMEDSLCEGDAACGLGGVYQQMGEYEKALEYHEMDLKIAEKTTNTACQCRAYGNLGLSYESLGEYQKAIQFQEQHLSIAAQMNDRVAKTLAYSSLGRVHHALNHHSKAVDYLRQGLQIAEQLGRMEDEAKIRHRLGLALWGNNNQEECQHQLYKASELFESIRRDAQFNSEYKLSLFDLQTACYQALQRVLVTLKRHSEALVVAERACTRAFIDLLMERQAGSEGFYGNHVTDPPPITTDQITSIVGKQKSVVLYFSVAAGFLYSWLLTPKDGIVKFQETSMSDVENEVDGGDNISMKSSISFSTCSLLDNFVGQIRESMGVESHAPSSLYRSNRSLSMDNDSTSDVEEQWEQHLEEIGDKLNAENDRTGFLRIVNRNHLFNSSNYSLGSLLSVSASLNGCNASFPGATISRKNSVKNRFGNKSAISALYQLLIEPYEEALKTIADEMGTSTPDLILVLQGELYLIPFTVLRKDQTMDYLFERYNLIVVPSLTSLQNRNKHDKHGRPVIDSAGAVIVGNPKLTPAICQHWHLHDIPASEYEARIVGEILTARPFIGQEATKGAVLSQMEQVEVIHFATHISWKLSSVILTPSEVSAHPTRFPTIDSDDSASDISSFDGPSLSEYLLTAADILNLKLHAKLVVLSAGYTDDRAGRINADGVVGLTRALLSAGAKSVLFCLWPVPDQASKLLMRSLYEHLSEGKTVSQALSAAMKVVQTTRQFSHPSNWGGWVMMGQDVKLSSKVAQMGHAICELLSHPAQCREAMRVLLHLIEKSLQRIHQGSKNSMYTTSQSIENKVGGLSGWKDLLQAVGFRFEPSLNGLPPAVFFPQTDPGSRLTQASASLQALLGLPQGSLQALSKFLSNYEAGETFIRVMRDVLSRMVAKDNNMDVKVNVKLWRVTGCHEFLASLGMDLVEVGNDEITLRLGKQANKRHLQFALQSLVSVFDTQEAPRSLNLDSSSSLESLSSSQSGSTSTSNFSKGSTPPLSPRSKKKSLFNPAEMEKMRIRNNRMSQGGLTGRKVSNMRSPKTGVNDPSLCLQYQNQIKTMYRTGTTSPLDGTGSDVCVTALSDSDTPVSQAQSPLSMGSSSASERLQNLIDAESYDLSFDGRFQKSDNKLNRVDSHTGLFVVAEEMNETVHQVDNGEEYEEQDLTFTRNSETRNSDMSDNSSISQGIQADQDPEKRGSDVSDVSVNSEGKVTPKNHTDIDTFLPTTDESGIVSETTSSNHSGSSHLEEQSNYTFDPAEIAQKIMMDVSEQKSALDSMQKFSMIQSHQHSSQLRNEFQGTIDTSTKEPNTSQVYPVAENKVTSQPSSIQAKIAAFSGNNESAFTSPSNKGRVPPQLPAKPTFQSNAANFRNLSANVTNLSTIKDSKSSTPSSDSPTQDNMIPPSFSSAVGTSSKAYTTQAILVSKDSFSSTHSTSTTMSFSSFRPAGKPSPVDNLTHMSSYRPDSTTSTSSYCSTPSSVRSVIYKPYGDQQVSESSCVGSHDSSGEPISGSPLQTSGSPSPSAAQPTTVEKDESTDITKPKRDASPALSTCSSTSSKGGKQKKKVSFSDSEPSDTPSPSLNSSASSNLYFDMNNLSSSHSSQYSRQSSLNNSTESFRSNPGQINGPRPPPPSYQYALKNSSVLGKSLERGNKLSTQNSRDSSNSSLNSSVDEASRVSSTGAPQVPVKSSNQPPVNTGVPNSPVKHYTQTPFINNSPSHKVPSSPSRSQYPPPIPGKPQHFNNMPEIKPLTLTSVHQPGPPSSNTYQTQPILYPRSSVVPQSPSKQPNNVPTLPRRQPPPVPNDMSSYTQAEYSPMSPPRSTVLRQPLTSDMSPEEYIPPSPVHSSSHPSPHQSPAHYPLNKVFPGQHTNQNMAHMGMGQTQQNKSQSQQNLSQSQRNISQIPKSMDQSYKSNGQSNQVRGHVMTNSDQGQTNPSFNSMRYQPPHGPQMTSSQNIPMQEFSRSHSDMPNRYPNQVPQSSMNSNRYNYSSTGNQPSPLHRGVPSSGVTNQTRTTSMSNIPGPSSTITNTTPVKKSPPVPPARIDSWSTMDNKQGVQNGPTGQSNGQGQGYGDYFSNNQPSRSMVGPQFSPKRIPFNNDRVGHSNNPQTFHTPNQNGHQGSNGVLPQQFTNGSIPNFQQYPSNPMMNNMNNNLPPGLRRVDLGSDKRSFAKTNVIHASKC